MDSIASTLLTEIITYGPPMLGVCLLLSGLGIPLPMTLIVMAAGAFIRQGILTPEIAGFGLACVVAGDSLSFALGRAWLSGRFGRRSAWQKARRIFEKQGGVTIYLSRWLLTGIATPTNLLAGGSGYRFESFLLFDVAGEMTWFVVFGGLGYWLGSQWETAQETVANLSGQVGMAVLAGLALLWGTRKILQWVRLQAAYS